MAGTTTTTERKGRDPLMAFRVPPDVREQLRQLADEQDTSQSALIRTALDRYLDDLRDTAAA